MDTYSIAYYAGERHLATKHVEAESLEHAHGHVEQEGIAVFLSSDSKKMYNVYMANVTHVVVALYKRPSVRTVGTSYNNR